MSDRNSKFSIGPWLQDPIDQHEGISVAAHYAAMGMNRWMGIYRFPHELPPKGVRHPNYNIRAMGELQQHGFRFYMNTEDAEGIRYLLDHPEHHEVVEGVLIGDEPDMHKRYRPQQQPEPWAAHCLDVRTQLDNAGLDRVRIWANFGKGFAKLPWVGYSPTGPSLNVDHELFVRHIDVASVDIYNTDPYEMDERPGHSYAGLWILPLAVQNTRYWMDVSGRSHAPVWGFVECGNSFGHLGGYFDVMPWKLIGAAAWLQVIAGAEGLLYFPQHRLANPPAHILPPTDKYPVVEPLCRAAVTATNESLHTYAHILYSQKIGGFEVKTDGPVPVLHTVREVEGTRFLFVIGNGNAWNPGGCNASIRFRAPKGCSALTANGKRIEPDEKGYVTDDVSPYGLRIYQMPVATPST